METSYRELKCKDVINITDGRNLGRTCDVVFTFPEGRVFGIVVPGKRGICPFRKNDLFIPLKNIAKIGTDAVLVDLKISRPEPRGGKRRESYVCQPDDAPGRRDFGEYE